MAEASHEQGVVPYILTSDGEKHMKWMEDVLGGTEKFLFRSEDGKKIAHAVMGINGGCIYLTDASCEKAMQSVNDLSVDPDTSDVPEAVPKGFLLQLELEDPEAVWKKAMDSGCTVEINLEMQFWGGLYGSFRDPFGFPWSVMKVKPGEGKRGVVPYLLSPKGECEQHIEWLKTVYNAEVLEMYNSDDKKSIMHCAIKINNYTIYMADQSEREGGFIGRPSRFHCHLSLRDPKPVWELALSSSAMTVVDMKVQFWGGLQGTLQDKFGFRWSLSPPGSADINSSGVLVYLLSPDAKKHIEFIEKVFDGKVRNLYYTKDGNRVMHCSMAVNDGELCLADQLCTEEDAGWPERGEARGFMSHLDMSDPDTCWKKAMENGASQVMELKKQFWGDYYGIFKDPLGYGWALRKTT